MRVEQLSIDGFRGFDVVVVRPRNHVALVGEPRAGRSDLIAALERVLQVEATRWQVREWDFHAGDLDREIRIEVTLTDLDEGLRQRFLRRLEPWDSATGAIIETSDVDDEADSYEPALRLRWTCTWDRIEERGEQRVEYVKRVANSGANANRVAREDRAALPFKAIAMREPRFETSAGQYRRLRGPRHRTGQCGRPFLGDCLPLGLPGRPDRSPRFDLGTRRRVGDRRFDPGRLARRSGVLRRGAADLRTIRGVPHGARPPLPARTSNLRSVACWKLTIGSASSRSTGTTGTRPTAPPTTGSSCSHIPARR